MSLTRLIYTSRRLDRSEAGLEAIRLSSLRYNERHQITGALIASDEQFAQVLEGEREVVSDCLARIMVDPRHRALQVVCAGEVQHRMFPNWNLRIFDEAELSAAMSGGPNDSAFLELVTLSQIVLEDFFRRLAVQIEDHVPRPVGPLSGART